MKSLTSSLTQSWVMDASTFAAVLSSETQWSGNMTRKVRGNITIGNLEKKLGLSQALSEMQMALTRGRINGSKHCAKNKETKETLTSREVAASVAVIKTSRYMYRWPANSSQKLSRPGFGPAAEPPRQLTRAGGRNAAPPA